jgi:hypothetical protein
MAKKINNDLPSLGSSINLEKLPNEAETIEINGMEVRVDEAKVEGLQKEIAEKREELRTKVYAVSMDEKLFSEYANFIREKAEWNATEALGIIEISKAISRVEKDGIKDNTLYLNSLTLEASHYFISKCKGCGLEDAKNFIKIYKPIDIALNDVKEDSLKIRDLEKQLTAAQQGLELA